MTRVFAYCIVQTDSQAIDDQLQEIAAAGFDVQPDHTITEKVSGSLTSCERLAFNRMMADELLGGDAVVVTKLDRLGRNAMDVLGTIGELALMNVKVHCLALGTIDLTSPAGKATMNVITAVAEFERDLLVERTQAGLARAKSNGKVLGRPRAMGGDQETDALQRLADGESVSAVARALKTSRTTIMRLRDSRKTSTHPPSTLATEKPSDLVG